MTMPTDEIRLPSIQAVIKGMRVVSDADVIDDAEEELRLVLEMVRAAEQAHEAMGHAVDCKMIQADACDCGAADKQGSAYCNLSDALSALRSVR